MTLSIDLFNQAFACQRTQRSQPYKDGAMHALVRIFEGQPPTVPYKAPSAALDAYMAGRIEGQMIASDYMAALKAGW